MGRTWGHSRKVRRRALPETRVMGPLTSDSDCRVKCLIRHLITSDLPTCTQQHPTIAENGITNSLTHSQPNYCNASKQLLSYAKLEIHLRPFARMPPAFFKGAGEAKHEARKGAEFFPCLTPVTPHRRRRAFLKCPSISEFEADSGRMEALRHRHHAEPTRAPHHRNNHRWTLIEWAHPWRPLDEDHKWRRFLWCTLNHRHCAKIFGSTHQFRIADHMPATQTKYVLPTSLQPGGGAQGMCSSDKTEGCPQWGTPH